MRTRSGERKPRQLLRNSLIGLGFVAILANCSTSNDTKNDAEWEAKNRAAQEDYNLRAQKLRDALAAANRTTVSSNHEYGRLAGTPRVFKLMEDDNTKALFQGTTSRFTISENGILAGVSVTELLQGQCEALYIGRGEDGLGNDADIVHTFSQPVLRATFYDSLLNICSNAVEPVWVFVIQPAPVTPTP